MSKKIVLVSFALVENNKGGLTLVSTGVTAEDAFKSGTEDGAEYCKKQKKKFLLVDHKSEYQGMSASEGASRAVASGFLGVSAPHRSPNQNFKDTINFKCE